jgi:hypothetical protein
VLKFPALQLDNSPLILGQEVIFPGNFRTAELAMFFAHTNKLNIREGSQINENK